MITVPGRPVVRASGMDGHSPELNGTEGLNEIMTRSQVSASCLALEYRDMDSRQYTFPFIVRVLNGLQR